MSLSVKRLMRDYKYVKNENLEEQGLYCIMNEENIYEIKAMVVGPKDTPYEGGFYFFLLKFSKEYPHKPPSITFHTLDNRVRFNPNYYKCGKVCLSILGTWAGPGWTSCMNLNTILLILQTRLNEMPIQNEPGYENNKGKNAKDYNEVLKWYNLEVAVAKVKNELPPGFKDFKPYVIKEFENNKKYYTNYLNKIKENEGRKIKSRFFSIEALLKPKTLLEQLGLENKIEKEPKKISKKTKACGCQPSVRKVPKEKASSFEIGTIKISETTGKEYVVTLRKDNRKYWKRKN